MLLGHIKHHKHSQIPCLCFFPIQHRPCHNNIVSKKGLNLFDECAAECALRKNIASLIPEGIVKDHRQINFIIPNRFCLLSKKNPSPVLKRISSWME